MTTCGKPVTVTISGSARTQPCANEDPGHAGRCAAWFQLGDIRDSEGGPVAIDLTFDTEVG